MIRWFAGHPTAANLLLIVLLAAADKLCGISAHGDCGIRVVKALLKNGHPLLWGLDLHQFVIDVQGRVCKNKTSCTRRKHGKQILTHLHPVNLIWANLFVELLPLAHLAWVKVGAE